jgi:GT2 family glycosyltransferase
VNYADEQTILVGIVTMNRIEKLTKTLMECSAQGFHDIVVVDNGSSDGSREFLSRRAGVRPLFPNENEGGSGGFNRLMRHFIENTQHKWLLLFDDDAFPTFSMTALSDYLSGEMETRVPAFAFRVNYPDGSVCTMNRPGMNILNTNPFRALLHDHHIREFDRDCLVDCSSFVGILLRRETIERLGYVSRQFFIYSDDIYYTLSISSTLGKIRYCHEFAFTHDCDRSSRRMSSQDSTRLRRDVANKIVLLREYSRYFKAFCALYVIRQILLNPRRMFEILEASRVGMAADLGLYKNERPCFSVTSQPITTLSSTASDCQIAHAVNGS